MKILLVNPPGDANVRDKNVDQMYPYALLFLSSYLNRKNVDSKILDLTTSKQREEDLNTHLTEHYYDIIGFTCTTESRFIAWDLIKQAKKSSPESIIVVGGNHFSKTVDQTLNSIPEIDFLVRGEGEITLYELSNCLKDEKSVENVLGISYRHNGSIINTPDRPAEMDLDVLTIDEEVYNNVINPVGNYSPFIKLYNYYNEEIDALPIIVGRGCPAQCVYCLFNQKKYRTRSVDSVISEIKKKIEIYNTKYFHLDDPHIVKRKSFITNLCNRIIKEKIDIKWYAETRADIDLDMLPLMKKAGLISLDFGLETATPHVLKSIKKRITPKQVEDMIHKCHELDIKVRVFAMISLPDETEKDAYETFNFLESFKNKVASYGTGITKIYPGTELEKMAIARGILAPDFDWYNKEYRNSLQTLTYPGNVPLWLEYLSPQRIKYFFNKRKILNKSSEFEISKSIRRNIKAFLIDWSKQGRRNKLKLVTAFNHYLIAKLKYRK